jgi:hypothetical protein
MSSILDIHRSCRGLSFVVLLAGSALIHVAGPAQRVTAEQALLNEVEPSTEMPMSVSACVPSDSIEAGASVDGERALLNHVPSAPQPAAHGASAISAQIPELGTPKLPSR